MQTQLPVSIRLKFVLEELEKILESVEECEEPQTDPAGDFLTR